MKTRSIFIGVVLGALAIMLVILIQNNISNRDQPILAQEYMHNVAMTKFDLNGRLQQFLSADSWKYYQSKQGSILSKPKLIVYKENGSTWKLQSDIGTTKQESLASKSEFITLEHNVVIQRLKSLNITPVKFTTSKALYYPEQELITSTKKVTMEKPGTIVTGVGLKSYMDSKYAKLLSNVKTIYIKNNNA